MLDKIFDWNSYKYFDHSNDGEALKWVVDVNQEMNFIPDTEAVVSLAL